MRPFCTKYLAQHGHSATGSYAFLSATESPTAISGLGNAHLPDTKRLSGKRAPLDRSDVEQVALPSLKLHHMEHVGFRISTAGDKRAGERA